MVSVQQPEPLKILAIGSPLSQLTILQQKVEAINAKHGPFDACLIVGDLFKADSDGSELNGISLGKNALPESVLESLSSGPEVAPNLVFIGKSNILTTAQGLKIAAAGGAYDEATFASDDGNTSPILTKSGIESLLSHSVLTPASDGSLEAAKDQAAALPSAFQGVDVLLTTSPPPSLSLLSPSFSTSGIQLATPAPPLADVVKRARPRYMFWSEGPGFWEREPFGWPGPSGKDERWTRSIKLGPLGAVADGGKPARWFYATSLPAQTPTTAPPVRPVNATPNPLTMPSGPATKRRAGDEAGDEQQKRGKTDKDKERGPPPDSYVCKICHIPGHWIQECPERADRERGAGAGGERAEGDAKLPPGYVCKICQSAEHHIRDCPQKGQGQGRGRPPPAGYVCKACGATEQHYVKDCAVVREREQQKGKRKELGPAECWFCLSNPKVTKHLIVGIGKETYVTLPKGQLVPTHGAEPLVPGGGHVLIVPIAHHPTLLSIPAADALDIVSEVEAYKSALRDCYAAYGAVPVSFEIGRLAGRGGHAHVQVVPVPAALGAGVADAFRRAGEASGLAWEDEPERALARVGPQGNYFKVECPDGTRLVHLLRGNFDLQFGRMVLAGILGLHHRVNWKDCVQSEGDDKDDAHKFKKAFAPYLPS